MFLIDVLIDVVGNVGIPAPTAYHACKAYKRYKAYLSPQSLYLSGHDDAQGCLGLLDGHAPGYVGRERPVGGRLGGDESGF